MELYHLNGYSFFVELTRVMVFSGFNLLSLRFIELKRNIETPNKEDGSFESLSLTGPQ
jgi:hypothetical protein